MQNQEPGTELPPPRGPPPCRTPVIPHQDGAHHGNHHAHHAREGDEVVAQREDVLGDQDDVAPAEEGGRSIRPPGDQRAEIPSPLLLERFPSRSGLGKTVPAASQRLPTHGQALGLGGAPHKGCKEGWEFDGRNGGHGLNSAQRMPTFRVAGTETAPFTNYTPTPPQPEDPKLQETTHPFASAQFSKFYVAATVAESTRVPSASAFILCPFFQCRNPALSPGASTQAGRPESGQLWGAHSFWAPQSFPGPPASTCAAGPTLSRR